MRALNIIECDEQIYFSFSDTLYVVIPCVLYLGYVWFTDGVFWLGFANLAFVLCLAAVIPAVIFLIFHLNDLFRDIVLGGFEWDFMYVFVFDLLNFTVAVVLYGIYFFLTFFFK